MLTSNSTKSKYVTSCFYKNVFNAWTVMGTFATNDADLSINMDRVSKWYIGQVIHCSMKSLMNPIP